MTITNKLKYKAMLLKADRHTNEDDRPITTWKEVRTIQYGALGITSQEKYLSKQAKEDVVYRINVRFDPEITDKDSRIRINDTDYLITRIFLDVEKREMELSLNYVT